jgi:signal transduction histidine kinase
LRFAVRPVRKEDTASAMLIIEDVTQQRVAEQARNSFIAQVTHELRTPLTNIRMYVETAIDDSSDNPAVRSNCLNIINQETRRLERIVGEMLSVAEIEAGSFKVRHDDVSMDVMLSELESDYAAQAAEKKIIMKFIRPPKLPKLQGDRDKIALSLHNLLGNALKYTPAEGEVTVAVDIRGNQMVIDVADTGIGIKPEEAERVFDKFYRSDDPRVEKITGTGLGLTLAREVIRLHGGDVTVQSELNHGSTFTATFPVSAEAA